MTFRGRKKLITILLGFVLASTASPIFAADSDILKLLKQSREDSAQNADQWNPSDDGRGIWDLNPLDLLASVDVIFRRSPTASEVLGNLAATKSGNEFNLMNEIVDPAQPSARASASYILPGDETLIAQFESNHRFKRWTQIANQYAKITRQRRPESMSEKLRIIAAEAFENLGDRRQQLRALESVALNFPLTEASVKAFSKINDLRCQPNSKSKIFLSESFLLRLARQDIPDSGSREFVLSVLHEPVERRNLKAEVIDGVDLFSFYLRAGFLEEAKKFGQQLLVEGKHDAKDRAKLMLGMAKIFEDQESHGEAVAMLNRFLETMPSSLERPVAMLQLGEILIKQQKYLAAAKVFSTLKRNKRLARPITWMEFFALYQANELERAEILLRDTLNLEVHDAQNPGSREYWLGRIYEKTNRTREAVANYLNIIKAYSLSYYGYASMWRLDEISQVNDQLLLNEPLLSAGMPRGSTLHDLELVLAAKSDTDAMSNAALSTEAKSLKISSIVGKLQSSREIENFATNFPRPFWHRTQFVADRIGIDPMVVYSIMRAESRFRTTALSHVGALGLLQIMPYTGSKIARKIGDEYYRAEELADPDVNITYGAYYFNYLKQNLENLPLAIASYNAGPKAVTRWLRDHKITEIDLFIEKIPFRETRKYVKEVLANLYSYERLYKGRVSIHEMQNLPGSLPDLSHLF
jgi:soluble lytic murein transglycosylase-like protein